MHIRTGTKVVCPPQTLSLTFNKEGKVIKYTGGYVMDKTVGNSGGLGGKYMYLHAYIYGYMCIEIYISCICMYIYVFIHTHLHIQIYLNIHIQI